MKPTTFSWRMPTWPSDPKLADLMWPANLAHLTALQGKYESIWMADHLVPAQSYLDPTLPTLEAWTALAYLAGAFPSYTFGHGVLNNSLRHPSWLAKAAATAQYMSGGRIVLGIGAGQSPNENNSYGYEYGSNAIRIGQLGEAVEIIRKLWTESPATFHGKYYRIEQAYCSPQPNPAPPILIGGGGERFTLPVVARHADWWNLTGVTPEVYAQKLAILRQCCEAIGRDPARIKLTVTARCIAIGRTEAEARRTFEASAFASAPATNLVLGTPAMVAEQLRSYTDLGIEHIILANFADYPSTEGAIQFAEEVMPLMR
jgi:alkanesulfonate monooxygenase SsuD/methylene tetrahydromethanopterin reductase-like flavin-dependent oxidoreductase (luciferase family)